MDVAVAAVANGRGFVCEPHCLAVSIGILWQNFGRISQIHIILLRPSKKQGCASKIDSEGFAARFSFRPFTNGQFLSSHAHLFGNRLGQMHN